MSYGKMGFSVNDLFDWASHGVDVASGISDIVTGGGYPYYPNQMTTALAPGSQYPTQYAVGDEPSFFDKYGTSLLLGAAALGAILLIRKK